MKKSRVSEVQICYPLLRIGLHLLHGHQNQ